jgi:sulfite reductase beta subunit-like hemoprotein
VTIASRPAPPAPREGSPADRCPGILRLHEAGDGALARVRLPGGTLTAGALEAVAAAAGLGSGVIDLTSRANLQVRGLREGDAGAVADLLWAAGLLPSPEHDRVRNVLASPTAGRHARSLLATDPVVSALDAGLCADPQLAELPGRFLFAVDDGSGLVDAALADVALVADSDSVLRLWLAGTATSLTSPPADAAELALGAARAFLAERRSQGPGAWRLADLPGGAATVAGRLAGSTLPRVPPERHTLAPGSLEQHDGRVALTALAPLGRLDRAAALGLAGLAREAGASVRVSARRTITLVDVAPSDVQRARDTLLALGLLLEDASGWHGLSACAGLGACPNARIDVRTAAAARAAAREPGARSEHWSACARGCGRPGDVVIAVTAAEHTVVVERDGEVATVASTASALALLAGGPAR